ncbi:phenylalanine--tRNA ligase subunit alpha [Mycoplasmopsis pulmonis]|uniref:phenylalanine--tRNA ligase subunit alpha n=1 Tax=Mycoplasmopsis pulmonis TaxID=2107 RepID=UPI001005050A|nr:phenylalanine--tRNA ligase subunit alpha [Mycoplasmopsis pulmonis]MDZ7293306.1 phenylalanine--tRNA ligase subunit alpha [Mycoplasmopsis pulmonis]VEU68111.1 phenylalanyl-tRNA synthetase subunit alpha [Mycoplasmopsis pulmonis]
MEKDYQNIKTLEELKQYKFKIYGKDGELAKKQEQIKKAPVDQKKILGQELNDLKQKYEKIFEEINENIKSYNIKKRNDSFNEDPFLFSSIESSNHPISLVEKRFRSWFLQNGYYSTLASEIESDEYNFERLNIAFDHPARDMQDSLYINKNLLLRTHNTGVSARELERNKNKAFSNFVIGKVYRNDEDDATHSHQFSQIDFISVGNVTFNNLIWTLKSSLSYVFEKEVEIRLRPSFFPFTEPSVEVDIFYNNKWIEVLGAGMIHPSVLKAAGYTNEMVGFAAGIGLERIAMIKYNISDIRDLYRNDLRFLRQFK